MNRTKKVLAVLVAITAVLVSSEMAAYRNRAYIEKVVLNEFTVMSQKKGKWHYDHCYVSKLLGIDHQELPSHHVGTPTLHECVDGKLVEDEE